MTFRAETNQDYPKVVNNNDSLRENDDEPILCNHCRRTASNRIKCKEICVADSDY